ncbi:MAG: transcriptional repressor, partial [Chloroflexi bacterium]|nr:transcriptional repressor [Chloroflexota bacterium]
MPTAEAILDAFESAGYRLTEPRRVVARLVSDQGGHFTADELVTALRGRHRGVGRATVFRSLEVLAELGLVERLDLPSGGHAFVACEAAHHHHVVCSRCGRSTDIADSGLAAIIADVGRRSGYRIESHRL